jgi:hypothetical protein
MGYVEVQSRVLEKTPQGVSVLCPMGEEKKKKEKIAHIWENHWTLFFLH